MISYEMIKGDGFGLGYLGVLFFLVLGFIYGVYYFGIDSSSLNGHILMPAKLTDIGSILTASFVFLFGPFPFIGNPGFAATIASYESILWWCFYVMSLSVIVRSRKNMVHRNPVMVFATIFLAGFIIFSALIEVNLGTSFRHRSILVPLIIFLYIQLLQSKNRSNS